ncbi:CidA/LrgA family protein, partial [Cloacibacillus sp.]|uniref:CidA/LrgA family protein n=1 Tax=Cloacibacillus sp. TaxID=2049023 RepID=UPI0025C31FFE
LPVPAGVYGLFILMAALCSGLVKLTDVEDFGGFLLEAMPMMFIPAAVGLLEQFGEIRAIHTACPDSRSIDHRGDGGDR